MAAMTVNLKGPQAILAIVVIIAFGGFRFLLPGNLHSREKKAIVQYIKDKRAVDIAKGVESMKGKYDKESTHKLLAIGEEALKEIEIINATVKPRGLGSGKKVMVKYKGKSNENIQYFKIIRRKGKHSARYNVYKISKKQFSAWW